MRKPKPKTAPKPALKLPKRIGDSPAINRAIGANVRRHRVAKGWSHAQLGARFGMSHALVQLYERGAMPFSAALVMDIAKSLGTPVMDLLDVPRRRHDGDERAERDTFRLARAMARIRSPRQRDKAIAFIYTLAGPDNG